MPDPTTPRYLIGARVEKTGGDYTYRGWVVAVFHKRHRRGRVGALRYVVEDRRGLCFIFNEGQLQPWSRQPLTAVTVAGATMWTLLTHLLRWLWTALGVTR